MKKLRYIITIVLLTCSSALLAQVPRPAAPQSEPIAIMNATIHIGNGKVIENGILTFDQGKITNVVDATNTRLDLAGHRQINAEGMQLYPGMIAANVNIGLVEIDAVRSTKDFNEVGSYNPHVRSIIAYNAETELIPTLRFNGITHAQIAPRGGRIPGSSSVVNFEAWNWEDAVVKYDEGIHLNWMSLFSRPRWWMGETQWKENPNYDKELRELRLFFQEAKAYAELASPKTKNLIFEAMRQVFNGEQQLYIHADRAKEVMEAVIFAKEMKVDKVTIIGASEAYRIVDFLKKHDVSVILDRTHRLPARADEDIHMPYKLPAILHEAGITTALGYWDSNMNSRNLPFAAGTAITYGLDKEAALQMVSSVPAKIMGVEDKLGTLEVGKSASLVLSKGDIFDMAGNIITHVFIDGKETKLHAKQQELYERYKEKYAREN